VPRPAGSVLGFYSRSAVHAVGSAARSRLGRDRRYRIGRFDVTLPAGHRLPWFQSVFPAYDRYAAGLLHDLCRGSATPLLIDVGANVGDTTLLALDAVDPLRVVAVEGDPSFLDYLRANTRQVAERVEIVDSFVEVESLRGLTYQAGPSTGGFVTGATQSAAPMVGVPDLLARASGHDLVIWKSDTDGLDVPILDRGWPEIDALCDVVWFELDPFLDTEGGARLPHLVAQLAASDRVVLVYDNAGRRMLTVSAAAASDVLTGLTQWLSEPTIPGETGYFDVWAVSSRLAHRSPIDPTDWSLGPG
jgi:FkbM family methyltransferase